MFKTYSQAELGSQAVFGEVGAHRWQYVELEVIHPWFYLELVRDHGDDVVGTMLMIPTVPVLRQMLRELDERSWFAQAHLLSPGYLRGGQSWLMEPLIEVSVAENDSGTVEGYMFRVEGGACYSIEHAAGCLDLTIIEVIFSAERDLRAF